MILGPQCLKYLKPLQKLTHQQLIEQENGVLEENCLVNKEAELFSGFSFQKVDSDLLKQLICMGFDPVKVEYALRQTGNLITQAMDLLLSESDLTSSSTTQLTTSDSTVSFNSSHSTDIHTHSADNPNSGLATHRLSIAQLTPGQLLNIFRAWRLRGSQPSIEAKSSLMEMGFPESEAVAALRVTGNDKRLAVSYSLLMRVSLFLVTIYG
ncbi:unnamed protein product [Protopolystoma xenopodis]|uniref:UBA domain-containing protein n=1 Tax=Protopolystoma xenopodis TaxID=117903 RepID=A0A448WI28_9PLAT|nr:unnamed protein product [Protopolystoma xenopodis]